MSTPEEKQKRIAAYKAHWRVTRARQREKARLRREERTPEDIENRRAYMREFFAGLPDGKRRDYYLRSQYGISLAEWQEMLLAQGGCCAICKLDHPGSKNGWATDHCHITHKVRGILCTECNSLLGKLGDTLEDVRISTARLLLYLERTK